MSKPQSSYIPALDGLRALAVLAVIAYHMNLEWAVGGLLGVTVFFVLSGYLITSLLVSEWDRTGTIDLPQFWLRRVRRLVPAIVTVLSVTAILCWAFQPALLSKMAPDIPSALLFFNNWWQIVHQVSYFEAMGAPSPLAHFWSLAIEEQYYLVFPPVLYLLFRSKVSHSWIRCGLLLAAFASVSAMVLLYVPGEDPSRVYYGTDTRAFSLLIGAWLAFAWPSARLRGAGEPTASARGSMLIRLLGAVSVCGLLAMLVLMDGLSDFPYYGGIFLCSLLTAFVIASLILPESFLGKFFAFGPFVWIGQRSYGMYLWHYPILLLMNPANLADDPTWWTLLAQLLVIVLVSHVSYVLVEDPIRKGELKRLIRRIRAKERISDYQLRYFGIRFGTAFAVVCLAMFCVFHIPQIDSSEEMGMDSLVTQETEDAAIADDPEVADAASQTDSGNEAKRGSGGKKGKQAAAASSKQYSVLVIGDSVALGVKDCFQEDVKESHVDAKISRQFPAGMEVYKQYKKKQRVGGKVVIALGTNGLVPMSQIKQFIKLIGEKKQIYFVNNRVPRPWQRRNNETFADAAKKFKNVHLIDWHKTSKGQSKYFVGDGIHLSKKGAAAYSKMIQDATK